MTDGLTDQGTDPLVEMQGCIKRYALEFYGLPWVLFVEKHQFLFFFTKASLMDGLTYGQTRLSRCEDAPKKINITKTVMGGVSVVPKLNGCQWARHSKVRPCLYKGNKFQRAVFINTQLLNELS